MLGCSKMCSLLSSGVPTESLSANAVYVFAACFWFLDSPYVTSSSPCLKKKEREIKKEEEGELHLHEVLDSGMNIKDLKTIRMCRVFLQRIVHKQHIWIVLLGITAHSH